MERAVERFQNSDSQGDGPRYGGWDENVQAAYSVFYFCREISSVFIKQTAETILSPGSEGE